MYQAASAAPSPTGQAYAPQGLFDWVSDIAPVLQTLAPIALSLLQAQPTAAGLAPAGASPAAMGPQMLAAGPQAYAPQGAIGDFFGQVGPALGGAIGSWAGNQQVGTQLGSLLGQAAKAWSPYSVAPTAALSPMGWNPAGLR
jgi:hypothetical protein